MKLRRILPLLAIAAIALSACAPVAQFARDVLDTSDDATVSYLLRTPETLPGLAFDPGETTAFGAILVARGEELTVLGTPEGVTCTATPVLVDCRLGDRSEPTYVYLTGRGVIASVTYRRAESTTVYQAFAR